MIGTAVTEEKAWMAMLWYTPSCKVTKASDSGRASLIRCCRRRSKSILVATAFSTIAGQSMFAELYNIDLIEREPSEPIGASSAILDSWWHQVQVLLELVNEDAEKLAHANCRSSAPPWHICLDYVPTDPLNTVRGPKPPRPSKSKYTCHSTRPSNASQHVYARPFGA